MTDFWISQSATGSASTEESVPPVTVAAPLACRSGKVPIQLTLTRCAKRGRFARPEARGSTVSRVAPSSPCGTGMNPSREGLIKRLEKLGARQERRHEQGRSDFGRGDRTLYEGRHNPRDLRGVSRLRHDRRLAVHQERGAQAQSADAFLEKGQSMVPRQTRWA